MAPSGDLDANKPSGESTNVDLNESPVGETTEAVTETPIGVVPAETGAPGGGDHGESGNVSPTKVPDTVAPGGEGDAVGDGGDDNVSPTKVTQAAAPGGGGDDGGEGGSVAAQQPVVERQATVIVVGDDQGQGGAKRTRLMEVGGSSDPKQKKKGELDAPPNREPACQICGKQFASWKAVFGHLRAHQGRGWKGAFPPPTFEPTEAQRKAVQEELVPALLEIARESLEKLGKDEKAADAPPAAVAGDAPAAVAGDAPADAAAAAAAGASAANLRRDGLVIDLNDNPEEEASEASTKSEESIDLNRLPKDRGSGSGSGGASA